MQSTNEPDDVERLLDVLGVPGLPYQSFRKLSHTQPPRPLRTTSARIESAFPLLAAAFPEIADAVVPHQAAAEQMGSVSLQQGKEATDSVAALSGRPAATQVPPKARPALVQATPTQVPAFLPPKPISAPKAKSVQEPSSPVETQIRDVFDMLRGTSRRARADPDNARGINSLFHRR